MKCTIEDFKSRKVAEAVNLLYNDDAKAYSLYPKGNPNSIIITPKSDSKIKTLDQAYRAAQGMLKRLNKEFGQDYMFDTFGNWGTIYRGPNDVRVEIKIPQNLEQAYLNRENFTRNLDYYNSDTALLEQEQREFENFFDLPASMTNQINFNAYVQFKMKLEKRAEKAIANLRALKIHNKSKEVNAKIRELEAVKTKIAQDIQTLLDSDSIFEQTISFINNDLAIIDDLLQYNNIHNLHTAEKMLGFYKDFSDYTFGSKNPMIDTKAIYNGETLLLDPSIAETLNRLAEEVNKRLSKLNQNKEQYLQDLIDNSSHIQNLFPEMEIEEMLKDIKDIDVISQFFLTIDKQFSGQDSLLSQLMKIELERSRSNNKAFVADIKARMNALMPYVREKLPKIASIPYWFGKKLTENDYSIFYQKDPDGYKTGRIVDKFSSKWFTTFNRSINSLNQQYFKAVANKDWEKANKKLAEKYKWISQHADFIDIFSLPEIYNDPRFKKFTDGFPKQEGYSDQLREQLGDRYYAEVVQKQIEQLEEFEDWRESYVEAMMVEHNVTEYSELPDVVKFNIEVTTLRNNPFELIKGHKTGQEGRVDYVNGSSSKQFQSQVKFIEFIPKERIKVYDAVNRQIVEKESGYYDNDFKKIEEDAYLYEFWKVLEEATSFINMNLADSDKHLKHGSILSMKKSFWDILIDPELGIANKFISLSGNLKQSIKDLITSKAGNKIADDFDEISKGQFQTNEEQINIRVRTINLMFERLNGGPLALVSPQMLPQGVKDFLTKEFGLPSDNQGLEDMLGRKFNMKELVRKLVTNQVVEEQTFNLPVLLRAYLEMVAEYKAQKESLPQLSIYKEFYEGIQRESSNSTDIEDAQVGKSMESIKDKESLKRNRVRANKRLNLWFNRNVKGLNDQIEWVNFGKVDWISYDKDEKRLKKELEKKLAETNDLQEQLILQGQIDALGANITLAAIYNSVINKFAIWKGLAYSVNSNLINWFQGWFQGMVYDTGKYWTAGNFFISNNFISKKGLRHLPGNEKYREEIKKTKLLINLLNIIQDATNEIDKARNESGLTGVAKKVQPFYLTEYTEWHNQTPQILAMLMDKTIRDKEGNEYPIFTGKEFPAYEIKDGVLKLKEEFRTLDNVATWEKFSSQESADNKLYMSEVIGLINGDYSKTGSTYIKRTPVGKTSMIFKTWLPNNIYSRLARKQTNLILGKKSFDGIYYSHRPTTLGLSLATSGLLVAGLPWAIPGLVLGMGIGAAINRKEGRDIRLDLNALKTMATIAQGILRKMAGIPVNALSGKEIVKQHKLGNLKITEQDRQNLQSIMNEISVLLSLVLFKVMIKGLIGDDEEDEPKTIKVEGKTYPNPYYPGNPRSEREKQMYNLIENETSRLIGDIGLYTNPKAMLENTVTRNSAIVTLQDITKLAEAVNKWNQGQDVITEGPNKGESRLWNQTKKMTLPGIIQDPMNLGFKESMEQEYDKTEYFDSFFDSDYKKDMKKTRDDRTMRTEELRDEFRKMYNYETLTPSGKILIDDLIDSQIRKIISVEVPYPDRILYDVEQNKIGQ